MINVEFYYSDNLIDGFLISGHAGYAESGYDIICSAVSALSINTVNSIEEFTDDDYLVKTGEDGLLELHMTTNSDSSQLLLASLKLGLQGIANTYGNEYVNILNWFQGGAMYHVEYESSVIRPQKGSWFY